MTVRVFRICEDGNYYFGGAGKVGLRAGLKAVYVLHTFQKKAKTGSKAPKPEIELVKERLKRTEEHYREWTQKQKKEMP